MIATALPAAPVANGAAQLFAAGAAALQVAARMTVSEWADAHRVLPQKGAAEAGPWRTSRTPYLREIMDRLSDHDPATDVAFMAASQVGKSEAGNNWLGYVIDRAPGPMLLVEPTIDTAEKYSRQRIAPMIDASPALRTKVAPARKRDSGNTTLVKDFEGGLLVLTGSNAASSLASMPVRYLYLDEIDRYPLDVDDEGDPVSLAEQRTITYARAKRYKASTPGRSESSRIARDYESGTRAQYWVPCPHCGELQVLHRRHLQWQKEVDPVTGARTHRTDTTVYVCQAHGCLIDERHKSEMLARGQWRHRNPERKKFSYHVAGVYAPVGLGRSWAQIAEKTIEAARDPAKLQPLVNLIDGEPYEDHSDRLRGDVVAKRAEAWPPRSVPPGYVLLTVGADTQDDRIAATLWAWAEFERGVALDHVEFPGDPINDEGTPGSPWDAFTAWRRRPVRNAFGVDLQVSATAIDSGGHRTAAVYKYVRQHRLDRVIATKGSSVAAQPVLGRPAKREAKNAKGDLAKYGVAPWIIGTDTAKDALYARLEADAELADPTQRAVRFAADLGAEFYEQLCAEVRDSTSGRYVKLRARNEALDCAVGAMAAAHHPSVRVHRLGAADWDYLRRMHEPRSADLFAGGALPNTSPAGVSPSPELAPQGQGAEQSVAATADSGAGHSQPASSDASSSSPQPGGARAPAQDPPAAGQWIPDRTDWI